MRLTKKKNGAGYLSYYLLSVKLTDARKLGFVDSNGDSYELEGIVDENKKELTIKLKDKQE